MEEAARVAGAGWVKTYFRIWLPLLMPTLALLAVLNFTSAAGATAQIILLASRETMTLSLLALELSSPGINNREAASIISIFIIVITIVGHFRSCPWSAFRRATRHVGRARHGPKGPERQREAKIRDRGNFAVGYASINQVNGGALTFPINDPGQPDDLQNSSKGQWIPCPCASNRPDSDQNVLDLDRLFW